MPRTSAWVQVDGAADSTMPRHMALATGVPLSSPPPTASSAKARSRAARKRSSGSFSRQRATTRTSEGGTPSGGGLASGSSRRIALIVSTREEPAKARRPHSISKRITPREKMSLRASASCPRTCSGDM